MLTVEKFSTFEELKSGETKATDLKKSLERHDEFEKFVLKVLENKARKKSDLQSK